MKSLHGMVPDATLERQVSSMLVARKPNAVQRVSDCIARG